MNMPLSQSASQLTSLPSNFVMSQKRGGFTLDANTMGLSTSKPPIATTRGMQQAKDKLEKETKKEQKEEEQKRDKEERVEAAATDAITGHSQCNPNTEPLPTEHFCSKVQKLRDICGDGARLNFEMNDIFLKRLQSIDQQCGGDSAELLRLVTLQDWVDQLLHVNYVLFDDMTAMEMEAYKKIMVCFQSSRGEQQQALDENRKLRKDMCAIIKFVQEAYHRNNWNINDMCLETLSVNHLLGLQDCQCPESESEKVAECMKSLAKEVAVKHDEICHLQAQLVAMDGVVQTARQKIMLKDECIAQLNQQLEELQDCVSKMTKDSSKDALQEDQSIYIDLDLGNLDASSCLFESLNDKDQQECELLRMLNFELSEFINLVNKQDFSAIERRRKLLSCFFEKINLERLNTLHKLDNLRCQLRNLDCSIDELNEPIAASTKILGDDGDSKLVESLRRRLRSLSECNKELNSRYQQQEVSYKVKLLEMQYTYEAERSINQKNCQALKEIADLISKLRCSDLSYEEIYNETSTRNPFCVAIMEMYDKLNELENSTDKEELRLNQNKSDTKATPAKNTIEPITTTTTTPTTTTTNIE
ncbi:uncharacterized protein LOC117780655 isoform X2 [Drosophila innubila]|uniref:uncharacterized protein LOC117780655 isoform X2 n=1 Tax=Drosophila innubila TaxID=198719 RepID=UPI00148B852C|nr:uncharacterized protein LOC117780655 isoform X2 [Drosophila innubila]